MEASLYYNRVKFLLQQKTTPPDTRRKPLFPQGRHRPVWEGILAP
jgi:hypothetical protein